MATLTIRDLDESLKLSLRVRAASRNRSMEEEARQILRSALTETPGTAGDMATRIRARFAGLGDVALAVPVREAVRVPPALAAKAGRAPAASGTHEKPRRRK